MIAARGQLTYLSAAGQSSRVVKYKGKNVNVTPHNNELRSELPAQEGDYTFLTSFNMGYEGFSKPWKMHKMNPVVGNRGEFLFLAIFFPLVLMLKAAREKNEAGLRAATGFANNRYAHLTTASPSEF